MQEISNVKSSKSFRREHTKALNALAESRPIEKKIIVYLGEERLRLADIDVLPVKEFVRDLHEGRVISDV